MDPVSVFVVLLAAWAIAQRTPGVVGQAAAEWRAGQRGETTEAAEQLRTRLVDAGVDPADGGGPLRNFLGNLWRDYWHDKDTQRQARRADPQAGAPRFADAQIEKYAERYRGAAPDDPPASPGSPPSPEDAPQDPPKGGNGGGEPSDIGGGDPRGSEPSASRPPIRVPSQLGEELPDRTSRPASDEPAPNQEPQALHTRPAGDAANTEPALEAFPAADSDPPIRVPATVGAPVEHPAGSSVAVLELSAPPTERTDPMSNAVATNGVAITTMTTGAYEMLSINQRLELAVQGFVNELTLLQNRLHRAGQSTIGTVQLSGHSTVMSSMAQAAEALAALKSAARTCTTEVSPLVLATKREFQKRI